MADILQVEKLTTEHVTKPFKCTEHALNDWLKRYALKNQIVDFTQTYVLLRGNVIIAYYSLVYGEIALGECPPDVDQVCPHSFRCQLSKSLG
jgi:hypothetical protein